jgi:hypothetical protein
MFDRRQRVLGNADVDRAMDVCLDAIHCNAANYGIKISLLTRTRRSRCRRLPPGVYTGTTSTSPS